ncbi:Uncharacterised protein [Listeria newyorkensis]|nr:Uncharacterised protein [Listeria newyorkensis]
MPSLIGHSNFLLWVKSNCDEVMKSSPLSVLYLKSRLPLETRTASREGGKHVNIFSTILAPVIVGCVLAVFNHWLETRRKKNK